MFLQGFFFTTNVMHMKLNCSDTKWLFWLVHDLYIALLKSLSVCLSTGQWTEYWQQERAREVYE